MKIEYSKEKLINLFLKGRKKVLSIGITIFTIIITLIIHSIQGKKIESLHINKDAELKKNEVLSEISRSEKAIELYKNLLSKKDASLVTNTLTDIARDSRVRLISIKPDTEINRPLYIKYPFILVIGADNYHAIGKFISSIENQPDIYFVDGISIRFQRESRTPDKESTQVLIRKINSRLI
ncbi:MAG: type 4a pilus biogenesis protein PilO [Candidatus Omnitrophota bacterium]|nr:type 4a pilus biogenesis protein PilO [Candidatus Omnitrophota bacterium]